MAHILIGKDNLCTCDCASKCVFDKIASEARCSKSEIESVGYNTIKISKTFVVTKVILSDKIIGL